MDAAGFLADVERVPATLVGLAAALDEGDLPVDAVPTSPRRVLLLGMGSSAYAAGVVAARLRAAGVDAVAELASQQPAAAADRRLAGARGVRVGRLAAETLEAVRPYLGDPTTTVVAVTEDTGSAVTDGADVVLPLLAGVEDGGVACRSYRHTLAVLLAVAPTAGAGGGGRGARVAAPRGRGDGGPARPPRPVAAGGRRAAGRPGRLLGRRPGGAARLGAAVGADGPRGAAPAVRTRARPATGRTSTCT